MAWFAKLVAAVGRFNCRIGDHHYEWRDVTIRNLEGAIVVRSQYRCARPTCPLHKHWITANVEKVRKPW